MDRMIKEYLAFIVTVVVGVILGIYFLFWFIAEGEGRSIPSSSAESSVGCLYFEGTIEEVMRDSLMERELSLRITVRFERLDTMRSNSRCMQAYRELNSILLTSDSLYTFCVAADSSARTATVGDEVAGVSGYRIRGWAGRRMYELSSVRCPTSKYPLQTIP